MHHSDESALEVRREGRVDWLVLKEHLCDRVRRGKGRGRGRGGMNKRAQLTANSTAYSTYCNISTVVCLSVCCTVLCGSLQYLPETQHSMLYCTASRTCNIAQSIMLEHYDMP